MGNINYYSTIYYWKPYDYDALLMPVYRDDEEEEDDGSQKVALKSLKIKYVVALDIFRYIGTPNFSEKV